MVAHHYVGIVRLRHHSLEWQKEMNGSDAQRRYAATSSNRRSVNAARAICSSIKAFTVSEEGFNVSCSALALYLYNKSKKYIFFVVFMYCDSL